MTVDEIGLTDATAADGARTNPPEPAGTATAGTARVVDGTADEVTTDAGDRAGRGVAQRLRERLGAAGVTLWVDGEQLRFRAPKGVLTPADLAELKAAKPELLALLAADDGVRPDPDGRYEPFPLTDVQAAYLLGRSAAFGYGGLGCHGYFEVAFPPLDPARLAAAWDTVVARHDMLRAVVHADGHQQVLADPPKYSVVVDDARGGDPAAVLAATRERMAHNRYEPGQWPLFELRLTRTDDHDVLHVSVDLLVADYTSVQLLLAELDTCYRAPGQEPPLPAITFRDWVLAERRRATAPAADRDRDWWLDRLDTLPAAPALPVLPGSAGTAPPTFRRLGTRLDRAEWAALRRRAADTGLTPTAVLLAGYAEVIGRWSAEPAFTLNLTLLNRATGAAVHPDVPRVVGDFTAVELLEVRPDPTATFTTRAAALADQLFTDLDHRAFGGVRVLRELARRNGSAAALRPVVFTSTIGLAASDATDATDATDGLTAVGELVYAVSQTPQVWIDCQVMEHRGELLAHWDVRDGVLPDGVPEDMFAAYADLLHRLATGTTDGTPASTAGAAARATDSASAATDDVWTSTDPVRLPAAQLATRAAVNATAAPIPDGLLHDGVLAAARRTPDRVAVLAGDRAITYGHLVSDAAAVAELLHANGCTPGEPVGVVLDKGIDQITAVLGVLLAGGAYLPVDTNQPAARRDTILTNSGVRLVLAAAGAPWPDGITVLPVPGPTTPATSTEATEDAGAAGLRLFEPRQYPAGETAYVIHTSGSTGVPKGVVTTHRAALNTVVDINSRFAVTGEDTVLGLAALGFDLSVYDIFGPLAAGGRLVLPDPDRRGDPSHWAELIARHGVTVWNSVPAQLQLLNDYLAVSPEVDLPTLRLALLSGDWIPVTLPDAVRARLSRLELVGLGGATEAAIWSIHHRIGDVPPRWTSIPYGVPLANQSWHVLDAALRPCPDHVPGELFIAGAGLAVGYLGNPDETAHRFLTHPATGERFYRTGDHGRYLPGGTIEFLGRRDDQVKIRGHRIELAEIEAALATHPTVGAAAVLAVGAVGAVGEPTDRRLAAFVTPAPTTGSPVPRAAGTGSEDAAARPGPNAGGGAVRAGTEHLAAVRDAAVAAGDAVLDPVRATELVEFAALLDEAALRAMLVALLDVGLFTTPGQSHPMEQVLAATEVAPRLRRLLRRWLAALTEHGLLLHDGTGYRLAGDPATVTTAALDECWHRIAAAEATMATAGAGVATEASAEDHETESDETEGSEGKDSEGNEARDGAELVRYLRTCAERLPELLRGEADPLELLFPEGRVEVAEGAYRDNAVSRYVNATLAAALETVARRHKGDRPLRVLEVGAGVGGTSSDLVAALAATKTPVEYLFTDLSQFFLNRAAERFAAYPWVRFGLFDLNGDRNGDHRAQGHPPNTLDVVVCANVLHNARHAGHALAALTGLIRPGGWLLFIEATKDSYPLMASMEFQEGLTDFTDERADSGRTFHARDSWAALLDELGAETAFCLPGPEHPLAGIGQHAFAARVKPGRTAPDPAELTSHLAARLPAYMLPAELQVVDALALTRNGKLDRAAMAGWLLDGPRGAATDTGDPPRGDLEERVAAVWSQVLGVATVGRDSDFHAIGGDSLLVAQVVGRLRETMPEAAERSWEVLMRQLIATPTVAALAEFLQAPHAAAAEQPRVASPLVALGTADRDTPTIVLVHDGSGTLAPYQPLVTALRDGGPLVGLTVADPAGYLDTEPEQLFDVLAANYRDALVEAGHKRVHVVGYCMGGLLATELARQLTEIGADVTGLTVVSSYRVPYVVTDDVLAEYAFARVMGVDPAALGYPADEHAIGLAAQRILAATPGELAGITDLTGALGPVAAAFAAVAARPQPQRLAAIAAASDLLDADRVGTAWRVFRQGLDAVTRFRAAPYAGDLTFLRQRGDTHFLPGLRADMTAYWHEVCLGTVSVVDIGGDHFSCLRRPHVDTVAALLREAR